jgi:energy-coupling factor transport system ATP-binding protein
VVLDDGKLLLDGTPEQVFSRPEVLRAAGLDVPQSAALIHELRKSGIAITGNVGSMTDCVETICRAYEKKQNQQ